MRSSKRASLPTRLYQVVIRKIEQHIQTIPNTIKDIVTERRCILCTSPFLPSPPVPPPLDTSDFPTPLHLSFEEARRSGCFCEQCVRELPRLITGHCPLCGELSPWPLAQNTLCLACLTKRPPWDSAIFHGPYEGHLRKMILSHKFSGVLPFGNALGRLLALHPLLATLHFDTIIPVPLHLQRLRQRGYNQSLEIAKGIQRHFQKTRNIQLLAHGLQRSRPTRPQMGLSHNERQKNVRGVFTMKPSCRNRHILLVDDVYTTGSTLRECCAVLKQGGAASVHIATLARTPRQRLKN